MKYIEKRPLIDFDAKTGFLVKGRPVEVWFVGGSGDLLKTGNRTLITFAALKALFYKWVEEVHLRPQGR